MGLPLTTTEELRPGTDVTPTLRLVRPLGGGGMGKVWVAHHHSLNTEVVVKFLSEDIKAKSDAAERFAREASVAASIKSPHVVQVFDHGVTEGGLKYIVMELLEGRDLAEHLMAYGKMSPRDVAALVAQVAKGLGKAHQVGVVHRDIKPENIFLCDIEGGEMFVKVLDFGIAKQDHQIQGSSTTTGTVVGTPYYMSPEQIVGDPVDARSDIWSLGVVVFEALCGARPFEGATVGAITLALHTAKPKMTALRPDLPPELDAWFARACSHDRSARFATVRDAANALLEAVGETPQEPSLIRGPLPSYSGEPAADGALSMQGAVTSLSSEIDSQRRKRPPLALSVGAAGVVLVLGVLAVLALRSPSGAAAQVNAAQPPAATTSTSPESPAPGPGETAAPATPSASESAEPAPTAAPTETANAPSAAAKPVLKRKGTAAPKSTSKRTVRDDDDIK